MEGNRDDSNIDGEALVMKENLFLDHVGEVVLTYGLDGLSWQSLDSSDADGSTCLGMKLAPKFATEIKFCDIYAVEFVNYGVMHGPLLGNPKKCFSGRGSATPYVQMYRFAVHCAQRSKTQPCLWSLGLYTFGHTDLQKCHLWLNNLKALLNKELGRPKSLLVFVHPLSGKANGCKVWETVAPVFVHAKVKTKVIVTQRAGHAWDVMASTKNKELSSYDGVVAVGGDGFFNEILNGFLSSRHKAPLPPTPPDFLHSLQNGEKSSVSEPTETDPQAHQNEGIRLLPGSNQISSQISDFRSDGSLGNIVDQDPDFLFGNGRFRFGLIPSGSTDAIVMCTTGARDPITSALNIVLGRRLSLDIAQVVRWKTTPSANVEPSVRYAASFAGYGFYGDVISESEKYRWMGPKRYDYGGTKVFLKHRSYEAEVSYLESGPEKGNSTPEGGPVYSRILPMRDLSKPNRVICRTNCSICIAEQVDAAPNSCPEEVRWSKSKGCFLSVGAAVMSNRNEKAPDGLVADAHLSDGFLHLILIKDCPRAMYLWHLTQLAKRGGTPLNFDFVEYHKTRAFAFTSLGNKSVWNLDGELFEAHKLSAQVFRGLICVFASGPEV